MGNLCWLCGLWCLTLWPPTHYGTSNWWCQGIYTQTLLKVMIWCWWILYIFNQIELPQLWHSFHINIIPPMNSAAIILSMTLLYIYINFLIHCYWYFKQNYCDCPLNKIISKWVIFVDLVAFGALYCGSQHIMAPLIWGIRESIYKHCVLIWFYAGGCLQILKLNEVIPTLTFILHLHKTPNILASFHSLI